MNIPRYFPQPSVKSLEQAFQELTHSFNLTRQRTKEYFDKVDKEKQVKDEKNLGIAT